MNRTRAIVLSVLVCVCCSCSPRSGPSSSVDQDARGDIVAVVGEERITAAEFISEWNRRRRGVPGFRPTTEQREQLLDELVREKAVLAKARAAGMERDPETVALIERLIVARYVETEFAQRYAASPEVEESEIVKFYESNPTRFQTSAAVRAGFIRLKLNSKADPTRREALLERAETLRAQAASTDGNGFKALVQQHSEDQATRYTGGDTGWLREGQPAACDAAVATAALQLQQVGEVAPVTISSNGFYIVRLLERRTASVRPLADVRETIRYELQQGKRQQQEQAFFTELKQGLKIEVNHAALNSISIPTQASKTAPPVLPGS